MEGGAAGQARAYRVEEAARLTGTMTGGFERFFPHMGTLTDHATTQQPPFIPDFPRSAEAVFPAQLDDVRAAAGFLRGRAAELGVDATRVVAWGESAGAHLAALLGLTDSAAVAGVVDWYGPAGALFDAAVEFARPRHRRSVVPGPVTVAGGQEGPCARQARV